MAAVPFPAQVPATESWAQLADTKLFYWDTGGSGPPIVLLHPATGSALIWSYQQPVFAKTGFRVIAYSRRGYYKSAPLERDKPGFGSEDLRQLVDALGIPRFHAVASAAGGSIAADFALSYPGRLLSLINSSNSFGLRAGPIAEAAASIRPKIWNDIPPDVRELGPSYRALNPEGVRQWIALEHKALVGGEARQMLKNEMTEAKLGQLTMPTLLIAGAADLITPVDLPHDRRENSGQRARGRAGGRPLRLLGGARPLQPRSARFRRQAREVGIHRARRRPPGFSSNG